MSYNVVDPSLELSDPCPDIHVLFVDFNDRFFEGTLAQCEVKWSPRMFSCAGVCSYEGRSGMCSIRLSLPLLKLRPRKDLIETLLHEMIHAFLFVTQRNRDRDGHGPEFQYHMYRINQMANTNITIYHSFHDEVNVYKQHIWRCDGPCRERRPFFGYVKRSSNRAPGPNDLWWNSHKANCNGTFIKIKEPEGYGQRKRKKPDEKEIVEKKRNNSLDRYFANVGKGQTCGTLNRVEGAASTSTQSSSSLTSPNGKKSKIGTGKTAKSITPSKKSGVSSQTSPTLDIYITVGNGSLKKKSGALPSSGIGSADCPIVIESDSPPSTSSTSFSSSESLPDEKALSRNVICPSCGEDVIEYFINDHLDSCVYLQ
uniref:Protein with SprT-like domain at the N terminus n=1 Tax=Haemonchus contortus TaxID=6289 RepID=A0A7I5ECE1_HAECO